MTDHPMAPAELQRRLLRTLSDATLTGGGLRYTARFAVRTTLSSRATGPFPSWTIHAAQESPARTSFELRAFEQRADGGVTLLRFVVHDGRAVYTFDGERWGFLDRRMSEWSGLLPRLVGGVHRGLVDVAHELRQGDGSRADIVRGRIDGGHAMELVALVEMASGGGLERALDAVAIEDARFEMVSLDGDTTGPTAQLSFRAALPAYRPGAAVNRAQQHFYLGFGRPEVVFSITFSLHSGGGDVSVAPPAVDPTLPKVDSLVDAMLARVHGAFAPARPGAGARPQRPGQPTLDLGGGALGAQERVRVDLPPLGNDDFERV